MELLNHVTQGFALALTLQNMMAVFVGCVLGIAASVLPRVGLLMAMAMLLPAAYALPPVAALILLAAVYCGAQYGSAAAWGSLFAGCMGTVLMAVFAYPMLELALSLQPVEYCSLMLSVLMGSVVLGSGSLLKGMAMLVLGMLLGTVGAGATTGVIRFSFDIPGLAHGIGLIAVAMGLFAYGGIIRNVGRSTQDGHLPAIPFIIAGWRPARQDLRNMFPAILRGTMLGALLGLLPGGSTAMAAFAAYRLEKKTTLKPNEVPFETGNMRGVAASESASHAAVQTAFIPLLALGIAPNAVMAMLMGTMLMHNTLPGPQLLSGQAEVFWGLAVSLLIGHLMLLVLNLSLAGIWTRLARVPYRWLFPCMVLLCSVGVYSVNNSTFDIWLVSVCALIGYLFAKLGAPPAPLLMGFVLGPGMEDNLRRALAASHGDWSVFLTRPLSAGLLAMAALLLVVVLLPSVASKRKEAFVED